MNIVHPNENIPVGAHIVRPNISVCDSVGAHIVRPNESITVEANTVHPIKSKRLFLSAAGNPPTTHPTEYAMKNLLTG